LDIPTHTVNMTTLRSTHDLWQSYSMSPYEVCYILFADGMHFDVFRVKEPSSDTLAQFLLNNEGERCVVVLDVRFPQSCSARLTHFNFRRSRRWKIQRRCTLFSCLGNLVSSYNIISTTMLYSFSKAAVPLKRESDMLILPK
jgi:hypothetical protein